MVYRNSVFFLKKLLLIYYYFVLVPFIFLGCLPLVTGTIRQPKCLLGNFLHLTWKDFWQVCNCMHTRKFSTLRFAWDLFQSIKNFSVSWRPFSNVSRKFDKNLRSFPKTTKQFHESLGAFPQTIKEIWWKFESFSPKALWKLMIVWELFHKASRNLIKVLRTFPMQ